MSPKKKEETTMTHEQMIATALNAVMSEVTYVQKGGEVSFGKTKYSYMSEADLLEVVRPVMVKYGLVILPSCDEVTKTGNMTTVKMTYTIAHRSGAVWPFKMSMWGQGVDSGDKGIYKAITGANKYYIYKLFNLPTGDDPESGNQTDHKTESKPQTNRNRELVLDDIMKDFPSASEEDRSHRIAALNAYMLSIGADPVDKPDQVQEHQWAEIVKVNNIKGA